jgi:hypothetical protein
MYLDSIADRIRAHIAEEKLPRENVEELFRLYAVLLLAKGLDVTQSDVHNVWAVWTAERTPEHESLVPYTELPSDIQEEDRVFVDAIRRVCVELNQTHPSRPQFTEVLFPFGAPKNDAASLQTLELYRTHLRSQEGAASRFSMSLTKQRLSLVVA